MVVAAFNDSMTLDGIRLNPGTRYILPVDVFQRMINFGHSKGIHPLRHSGFNAFEKRFNPHAAKRGDPVILWRHNAFGDNLMATGACGVYEERTWIDSRCLLRPRSH